MRISVLTCLAAFLLSFKAFSQEGETPVPVIPGAAVKAPKEGPKGTPYFMAGIRAGANYATMRGIDSADFITGYAGGLFLTFSNGSRWSISADMLYSQKGTTFERNSADTILKTKTTYNYQFNYIEIPVLFRYNFFNDSSHFRANVFAGPSIHIRQFSGSKMETTTTYLANDSTLAPVEKDEDLTYTYTPLDYGFVFGAGATYAASSKITITLDLRGNMGLLDLREYVSKSGTKVKNLNAAILLGVAYKFGK